LAIHHAKILERARASVLPLVPSFIAGIFVAQVALVIGDQYHNPARATALAIIGDSVGFYGAEFIRRLQTLRGNNTSACSRIAQAFTWLISEYAVAEIIDVCFMRAWTVGGMNLLINNGNAASVFGNFMADALFVLVVLLTGTDFSVLVVSFLRRFIATLGRK